MRVKLLLSCALLTNLVGVYGSGTEVPRHNEEAAGSRSGEAFTVATSKEVVCSKDQLQKHPHKLIRALGDLVESAVCTEDNRPEIVRINISKELQRAEIYKLWGVLNGIMNQPNEVGFQCRLSPGFLHIESINLLNMNPNTPERLASQEEIMDYEPLSQILRLATVNDLGVTVQSDDALDQLIQLLSVQGSLRELSINNINDTLLLRRIGGVFEQNQHLKKLSLTATVRKSKEVVNAEDPKTKTVYTTYSSHQFDIDPQLFRHLTELRELTFVNLEHVFTEEIKTSRMPGKRDKRWDIQAI